MQVAAERPRELAASCMRQVVSIRSEIDLYICVYVCAITFLHAYIYMYMYIYIYPPTLGWRVGHCCSPLKGGWAAAGAERGYPEPFVLYWNLLHKILDVAESESLSSKELSNHQCQEIAGAMGTVVCKHDPHVSFRDGHLARQISWAQHATSTSSRPRAAILFLTA